jgi:hypothetical protein
MTVIPGTYRHYKGNYYQVLATARHSETEEVMVIYRCLYGERTLWVRPLQMFHETVTIDGREVPRFSLTTQPPEGVRYEGEGNLENLS